MARARSGSVIKPKLNMLLYGEPGVGKSTLALQIAKFKREDGTPFRVLVLDAESGGCEEALGELEEDGVDLRNIYLVYSQSQKEIKDYIAKVRDQNKEHFVAQFDIPIMTLIRCAGKGYYETSGYDVSFESVREYAIPVEDIRPSFLDGYVSAKSIDTGNNLDISKSMEKPFIMPQESSLVSLIDVVQEQ